MAFVLFRSRKTPVVAERCNIPVDIPTGDHLQCTNIRDLIARGSVGVFDSSDCFYRVFGFCRRSSEQQPFDPQIAGSVYFSVKRHAADGARSPVVKKG